MDASARRHGLGDLRTSSTLNCYADVSRVGYVYVFFSFGLLLRMNATGEGEKVDGVIREGESGHLS